MKTVAIRGFSAASVALRQPRHASLDLSVSHRLISATGDSGD